MKEDHFIPQTKTWSNRIVTLLKQLSRAFLLIRDETAKKSWERDKNEGTQ